DQVLSLVRENPDGGRGPEPIPATRGPAPLVDELRERSADSRRDTDLGLAVGKTLEVSDAGVGAQLLLHARPFPLRPAAHLDPRVGGIGGAVDKGADQARETGLDP